MTSAKSVVRPTVRVVFSELVESITRFLSDEPSLWIPVQNLSTAADASVHEYYAKTRPAYPKRGAPRPTGMPLPDRMLTGRN